MVEADGLTEIGDIVTMKIARIPGIDRWTVCVGTGQAVGCQAGNLLSENKVTGEVVEF